MCSETVWRHGIMGTNLILTGNDGQLLCVMHGLSGRKEAKRNLLLDGCNKNIVLKKIGTIFDITNT